MQRELVEREGRRLVVEVGILLHCCIVVRKDRLLHILEAVDRKLLVEVHIHRIHRNLVVGNHPDCTGCNNLQGSHHLAAVVDLVQRKGCTVFQVGMEALLLLKG